MRCPAWWCLVVCLALVSGWQRSNNTNCSDWAPNTQQNVTIGPDVGTLVLGAECNQALVNIHLTFFCSPGALVHIDEWHLRGGFVKIVGPPEAPWSIRDVAVSVTSSTIFATGGPAVGVELGYGWPNTTATRFTAAKIKLFAMSTLLFSNVANNTSIVGFTTTIRVTNTHDIAITSTTFAVSHCLLVANGAGAAVAGVAIPLAGNVLVSQLQCIVVNSSVRLEISGYTFSASTVGGIAIGSAGNVAVNSCITYVSYTDATLDIYASFSASSIGGVALGSSNATCVISHSSHSVESITVSIDVSSVFSSASRGSVGSASCVGGVAVAWSTADVTVTGNSMVVSRTSTTMRSSTQGAPVFCVSAVGGIVIGFTASTCVIRTNDLYVLQTHAEVGSSGGSVDLLVDAASIGGVAAARVFGDLTVNSSLIYVLSSIAITGNSVTGSNTQAHMASSAGGIAVAYAGATLSVMDTSVFLSASNATHTGTTSCGQGDNNKVFGASSVGGIVIALTASTCTISNSTQYVAWTYAVSSASVSCGGTNGHLHVASGVGGIAIAWASAAIGITSSTQYVLQTNATSVATATGSGTSYATSASGIGSVSIGFFAGAATVTNSVQYVMLTNASSKSSSSSGSSSGTNYVSSASGVGGVAVGLANANYTMTNCAQYVSRTTANIQIANSAASSSTLSLVTGASSVGGLATGLASAPCLISNTTQFTAWANTNTTIFSSGDPLSHIHSASSVGGVSLAWASSGVTVNNNTEYVALTSATQGTAALPGSSFATSASALGGIAVAFTSTNVVIAMSTQYVSGVSMKANSNNDTTAIGNVTSAPSAQLIASRNMTSFCLEVVCPNATLTVDVSLITFGPCCAVASVAEALIALPPVQLPASAYPPVLSPFPALPTIHFPLLGRTRSKSVTRRSTSPWQSASPSITDTWSPTRTSSPTRSGTTTISSAITVSPSPTRSPPSISLTDMMTSSLSPSDESQTLRETTTFMPTASESRSRLSPSSTRSQTLRHVVDVSLPASTVAMQTTTSSLAVTSTVASVGSGASGANAGRISVVLKLAACTEDGANQQQQSSLDRTSHPLGFAVTSAGYGVQYDAGLVLGDTALGVVATMLHFFVTHIRAVSRRKGVVQSKDDTAPASPLLSAAMWSRFPGLSSAVHLYFLPLIAQSAMSCVAKGSSVGVIIGGWGLLLAAGAVVVLLYHTALKLPRVMECNTPIDSKDPILLRPRYMWTALPHHSTELVCTCFGAYFEDYQYHGRWWLCVEVATALAGGVVGGLAGSIPCFAAQVAAVVPNAIYVALVLWIRPHQRRLDWMTSVGVGTLLFASSVAACAGSTTVATATALGASVVGFVPALAAPYKLVQQYRNLRRRKKLQRAERRKATRAAAVLVLPLGEPVIDGLDDVASTDTSSNDSLSRASPLLNAEAASAAVLPPNNVLIEDDNDDAENGGSDRHNTASHDYVPRVTLGHFGLMPVEFEKERFSLLLQHRADTPIEHDDDDLDDILLDEN